MNNSCEQFETISATGCQKCIVCPRFLFFFRLAVDDYFLHVTLCSGQTKEANSRQRGAAPWLWPPADCSRQQSNMDVFSKWTNKHRTVWLVRTWLRHSAARWRTSAVLSFSAQTLSATPLQSGWTLLWLNPNGSEAVCCWCHSGSWSQQLSNCCQSCWINIIFFVSLHFLFFSVLSFEVATKPMFSFFRFYFPPFAHF